MFKFADMRTLLCLLLFATFAFTQTLEKLTYLVKAETSTFDPHYGWSHFCVVVYPGGKFHAEKEKVDRDNNKKRKVYQGQLPDASIRQLESATRSTDFQAIQTPWKHGGFISDPDVVRAWVPRENSVQFISFETAKQRQPYKKMIEPLLEWIKEVDKAKGAAMEAETPTDCAAPLVLYHRSIPDSSQAQTTAPR